MPGYPWTAGTPERSAAVAALARRYGVGGLAEHAVLPVIGTKELIAWLPTLLGLGAGDPGGGARTGLSHLRSGGAVLAGTRRSRPTADPVGPGGSGADLPQLAEQPHRPGARVDHLRKVVGWARERGTMVASDECYLGLAWDEQPPSVLHPDVSEGDHTRLLAVHSLSKSSSLAGLPGRLRGR